MSRQRPRMPQMGSRKWSQIGHHKLTHFQTSRFRSDGISRMTWIDRWLNLRAAPNPRWRV